MGGYADLFALVDKKHKIYVKKATALRPALDLRPTEMVNLPAELPNTPPMPPERELGSDLQKQVDWLILARYSPNAVVIDEGMQVLQFRGATSRFLEHAPGTASLNLLQMARPALNFSVSCGDCWKNRLCQCARSGKSHVTLWLAVVGLPVTPPGNSAARCVAGKCPLTSV